MLCHVQLFWDPMDCSPPGSSVQGIFPGNSTGEGCHFLLQGIFLTQGVNLRLLHLLHLQVDSLPLHHLGSPKIPHKIPPKFPPVKQKYFEELLIMKENKQIGNLEGYKCGYS